MKDIAQQLADALLKIETGLAAGLDCSRACKLNTHYHERVLGEAVAAVQAIKAALDARPQEDVAGLRARIAQLESGWVRVEERLPDVRHQLLKEGVTILPTDEILRDDCKTWEAIGNAWPIGYSFSPSFFVPIRRPLPPAPPQEEAK